jgi:hypothetical protein
LFATLAGRSISVAAKRLRAIVRGDLDKVPTGSGYSISTGPGSLIGAGAVHGSGSEGRGLGWPNGGKGRQRSSGQREALLSPPRCKDKTLYQNRQWLSRITMLSFEWASRIETVGFKLAGGKGLREGWDSKELWKSVESQIPHSAKPARGAPAQPTLSLRPFLE